MNDQTLTLNDVIRRKGPAAQQRFEAAAPRNDAEIALWREGWLSRTEKTFRRLAKKRVLSEADKAWLKI